MQTDLLRRALRLARRGAGRTSPNPMVGAVISRDGQVIGEGYHRRHGGLHAETEALADAERRGQPVKGATMHVSLEPCCVSGLQPPCTEALVEAGIARVEIGCLDANPNVNGKGVARLREAGIAVEVAAGKPEQEARRLNEAFFKHITTGMPFVTLKVAATLDGKIAGIDGESRWITGEKARAEVHRMRAESDAILVGFSTAANDNPSLTVRHARPRGNPPVRVVLDGQARLPLDSGLVSTAEEVPVWVICTTHAPEESVAALRERGVRVMPVSPDKIMRGSVDLGAALEQLGKLNITSLLVEGGSRLNDSMLRNAQVDKLIWYAAPKILGGQETLPAVGGSGMGLLDNALELEEVSVGRVGPDFRFVAYPRYRNRESPKVLRK